MHRRKRSRRATRRHRCESDDEDSESEDESQVFCRGSKVFFYADVSRKSVYKLISLVDEAATNSLLNPSGDAPCVYVYIHSDGGDAYAGSAHLPPCDLFLCACGAHTRFSVHVRTERVRPPACDAHQDRDDRGRYAAIGFPSPPASAMTAEHHRAGFVASAATFLLLAGAERLAMPNAHILIHQIRTGFWGKFNDLLDEVRAHPAHRTRAHALRT